MEIKCWEKEKKTRPYTWQHQLVVGGQWLSCKLNNLPANISRCVIDWQTDRLTEWLVELHVHKNFGLSFGFIHVLTFWHMFLVAYMRLCKSLCLSVGCPGYYIRAIHKLFLFCTYTFLANMRTGVNWLKHTSGPAWIHAACNGKNQ